MTNLVQFPALGLSFTLNRVAFSIGGINIYWYGVCIAVGMCLALVFAFRHGVEFGVDADAMVDVILIGVVMGILCARLYYVAMSPYNYSSLWDVLAIRDGGLAIYGGVIGGFLFGGLACKWRRVPVLPMFDLAAMGFLIGQGWPLGQLLQSGGIRLQHDPAVGHVQRSDPRLPAQQRGHGPQGYCHRPEPAGPPYVLI